MCAISSRSPTIRRSCPKEVVVRAFTPAKGDGRSWLADDEALRLLGEAKPDANIPLAEKRELVACTLNEWPAIEASLRAPIRERAAALERSQRRVRQVVGLKVRALTVAPQLPPDLLALLLLQPLV